MDRTTKLSPRFEQQQFLTTVEPTAADLCLFFVGDQILTSVDGQECLFRFDQIFSEGEELKNSLLIGRWEGKNLFATAIDASFVTEKSQFQLIHGRDLLKLSSGEQFQLLCCAKQLLYWHLSTLYCGSCGHFTRFSQTEIAKCCGGCNKLNFPSASPAVIVLVVRDQHILLARSPHFPKGVYSTLAGFVGVGESLEDAIHREVEEEVSVKVKNIAYFGSQPWPFPNSLMVGFQVEYESGEIKIDKKEIEDARWYSLSDLPLLPPKSSIARHLIDRYLAYRK